MLENLIDKEIELEPTKIKSKTAMDLYAELFLNDYLKYFRKKYGELQVVEGENDVQKEE